MRRGIGLVLVLVCLGAACTGGEDPEAPEVPGGGRGAWEELPAAPLAPREAAAATWNGTELFVWGGYSSSGADGTVAVRHDGAAYDPSAARWRPLPDAPEELTSEARGMRALAGGGSLVFIGPGVEGWRVARYDTAAGSWAPMAELPAPPLEGLGAAWTGREVLVWGYDPMDGAPHLLRYDLVAGRWQELPVPVPAPRYGMNGLWDGERLLLWGGSPKAPRMKEAPCTVVCNNLPSPRRRDVHAFDPLSGRWQELPDGPEQVTVHVSAAHWTGDAALLRVWEEHTGARWHRWWPDQGRARPADPLPYGTTTGPSAWSGRHLLMLHEAPGQLGARHQPALHRYDPRVNRWERLPGPPSPAKQGVSTAWTPLGWITWGGGAMRETGGRVLVDHTGAGAIWRPDAPAAAQPSRGPADFRVSADIRMAGVPLGAHLTSFSPLGLDGESQGTLQLSVSEDVYLRPRAGQQVSGLMEQDGGRLIAVGPLGTWSADPAHPELGLQAPSAQLLPEGFLNDEDRLDVVITLKSQQEPFAPTAGTYQVDIPVEWWHRRPPPEAYPEQPDGRGAVRLTFTVEALTAEAARDRSQQPAARAALAKPPCGRDLVALGQNDAGAVDGRLQVQPDALGWFGQYAYGAPMAAYTTPDGVAHRLVAESAVLLNGRPLRECVHPTFSFDAARAGTADGAVAAAAEAGDGLRVEVTQFVRTLAEGAELVQRYTVTNTAGAPREAAFTRRLTHAQATANGQPAHAGVPWMRDGGARLGVLPATGGGPVVEVGGDLAGRHRPDRWGVWPSEGSLSAELDLTPLPEHGLPEGRAGRLARDADSDGTADEPYEPTLAQQWRATLQPGQTTIFTAVTRFRAQD